MATTQGSLERSRYAMEALEELPFHTPLGRVVIGRAGGDGAVEVSGPTTLAELRVTVERLQALGADQVLVDGAINRIGSASPRVSDGVVVATGGMVGDTLDDVLETTVGALDMLTAAEASDPRRATLVAPHAGRRRARRLLHDGGERHAARARAPSSAKASRWPARSSASAPTRCSSAAPSRRSSSTTSRACCRRARELRVVVRDATVLVLPPATVGRFLRARHRASRCSRRCACWPSPRTRSGVPQPYQPKVFFAAVADAVGDRVPVFDVVNGLASAARRGARGSATAVSS